MIVLQLKLVLDLSQGVVHGLDALLHRFEGLADLIVQALLEFVEVLEDVVLGQLVGLEAPFRFRLENGLDLAETLLDQIQLIVLVNWWHPVLTMRSQRTIHAHIFSIVRVSLIIKLVGGIGR